MADLEEEAKDLEKEGSWARAAEKYMEAYEKTRMPPLLKGAVRCKAAAGNWKQAAETFILTHPWGESTWDTSYCYAMAGEFEEALKILQKALERKEISTYDTDRVAKLWERAGNLNRAVECYGIAGRPVKAQSVQRQL